MADDNMYLAATGVQQVDLYCLRSQPLTLQALHGGTYRCVVCNTAGVAKSRSVEATLNGKLLST